MSTSPRDDCCLLAWSCLLLASLADWAMGQEANFASEAAKWEPNFYAATVLAPELLVEDVRQLPIVENEGLDGVGVEHPCGPKDSQR